jgi:hypothetical protein
VYLIPSFRPQRLLFSSLYLIHHFDYNLRFLFSRFFLSHWELPLLSSFLLWGEDKFLYVFAVASWLIVKLALLTGLRDGPFVVYIQLIQLVMQEQFDGLLDVDYSLNKEANVGLLLHLLAALIHLALEVEARPLLSRLVKESDNAVEEVKREAENVELFRLKLWPITVVIHKEMAADFEFEGVFAEGAHSVEEHKHHSEEAAQIREGSVETRVTAVELLNEIRFSEVNADQFVGVEDFKVADDGALVESESPFRGDVAEGFGPHTSIRVHLVLRKIYMRTYANTAWEFKIIGVLEHIV